MTDRIPGAPGQYKGTISWEEFLRMQEGEEFSMSIQRDDQPIVEGTPYSKAAVLPDDLAAQLCPNVTDPTPADAFRALHQRIYPVGSIYLSVLGTDPGTLFGGQWERLQDCFLLGAGKHPAGQTGGAETHKLSQQEMPAHTHTVSQNSSALHAVWTNSLDTTGGSTGAMYMSFETGIMASREGEGLPHNNMPPYLSVYMWKRVA